MRVDNSVVYNPLKAINGFIIPNNRPRIGHLNKYNVHVFKQNVCLINFDKFLTNVKLFHVYIKHQYYVQQI